MQTMPVYWKTRPEDVAETCNLVKKGRVSIPTRSAGGRPIYMVEYRKSNQGLVEPDRPGFTCDQIYLASRLLFAEVCYFVREKHEKGKQNGGIQIS